MTVKEFDTWQESVWIDTHLAAIRWKANLRKDRKHIRSSHSEDRLTWIVYRALEGENLVPQFCREVLGLPPTDRVWVYHWQRLPNSERIDYDINEALGEVEPCHTAQGAPRTETDLLLLARDWICPWEHKCGAPRSEPHGWRQRGWKRGDDSKLRHEYERFFRPLLRNPDAWHENGNRFAQLLKNLSLGVALARRWDGLAVHLGVIINGRVRGKKGDTYFSEFGAFRDAVSCPADRLHRATWQEIRKWFGRRQEALCRLACEALDENDLL
jgi:hypothetical protein